MRTDEGIRRPPTSPPWLNRFMSRLLRSPMSRLVDRGILLLSVFGRRTGRPYTFPVQYAQEGDVLWIYAGNPEEKTWWRNLVPEGRVEILLRRRPRTGRGAALSHDTAPKAVAEGLRRYVDLFPGTAKRLGILARDDEAIVRAATETIIVRVILEE